MQVTWSSPILTVEKVGEHDCNESTTFDCNDEIKLDCKNISTFDCHDITMFGRTVFDCKSSRQAQSHVGTIVSDLKHVGQLRVGSSRECGVKQSPNG